MQNCSVRCTRPFSTTAKPAAHGATSKTPFTAVDHRILNALDEIYPDRLNADRMEEEYLVAFRSVKAQLLTPAAEAGREFLTGQMASLTALRSRLFNCGATNSAASRLGGRTPRARRHRHATAADLGNREPY
jgi:hypothetical protein